MAVMIGKDDKLLLIFEELAIGELNPYDLFQEPVENTFIYNPHGNRLHESFFHLFLLISNIIN